MAETSTNIQNHNGGDSHSLLANSSDEEQLVTGLASMQQQLAISEIPEDPIAKFDYLHKYAMLYTARFLSKGRCLEEALSYSDQAKAHIPSHVQDSLFSDSDDQGFGDEYVFLRICAWYADKSLLNARRVVAAIEWKLEVAPASQSNTDIGLLSLCRGDIYQQTRNGEDLATAIQSCMDFLEPASNPEGMGEDELAEQREMYPSVLSTLSQLLYHNFRSSGKHGLLKLSMDIGHDVITNYPETWRPGLAISLVHASIAQGFCTTISDAPRLQQRPLDITTPTAECKKRPTATGMPLPHPDPSRPLYNDLPLASDKIQIRLLEITPGRNDDLVTCFLEVVDLESSPEYDALSYVWGDSGVKDSITVNGRIRDVTINLYDALKQLRKPDRPRRFWIDALCINQDDTKEKEGQIGLMGKIYSQANEVCMWLGEPTRTTVFSDVVGDIPCDVTAAEMLEKAFPTVYSQIKPHLSILNEAKFKLSSNADPDDLLAILYRLPFSMRPIPSAPCDAILSGHAPVLDFRNLTGKIRSMVQLTANINLCTDFEEVMKRNAWHQDAEQDQPVNFDWGREGLIPSYLESKLSGVDWPICGAFVLLNLLAMDVHFHDMPFFTSEGFSCMNHATAQAWNKSCFALYQMLTSKYWSRAWILQEVVLAKNPILYFGRHLIPYPRLIKAMVNFQRHYQDCCKDVVPDSTGSACGPQNWWMKLHEAFARWIENTSVMWTSARTKEKQGQDVRLSVIDIMKSNYKTRAATEPHDLVFSMFGLIKNDGPEAIPVDYSLAVEDVFTRATSRALIDSKEYLMLLSFAGWGRSEELKYKLPSWCWDLTAQTEWSGPFAEVTFHFDSFPNITGDARMERDLCLAVTTAKVDTVNKVSSASQCCAHSSWDDEIHNIHQWRECASLPNNTINLTITDMETNFWTTIFGGCLPPASATLHSMPSAFLRITDADLQLIPRWQDWLCDPSRVSDTSMFGEDYDNSSAVDMEWLMRTEEDFTRFNRRMHFAMMNRRFFVTEKGRYGTGPGSEDLEHFTRVEVDDEIHLMAGCRVPMILRPISKVKAGGSKYGNDPAGFSANLDTCAHEDGLVYQLVGPCYIDGIMDGEAMDEDGLRPGRVYLR